jgi:RNA polymerase sigma-70 factor (ECF subfamily)
MIITDQNYRSLKSLGFSLTPAVFMTDSYRGFRNKGRTMDDPSALSEISHEQLVIMVARNKDKYAFRQLFDHYAPRIKSYLLNFQITDQKAEDLTQEVMITLWQKADKFDPDKAKISTWLFRVARNKYIDKVRKQKYPEVNADDHIASIVAPEKTDRTIQEKQDQGRIKMAMASLSDEQQKVIELSFFKELSHSQIAAETNMPLGTVKSRIRTAFQILRKELGDYK